MLDRPDGDHGACFSFLMLDVRQWFRSRFVAMYAVVLFLYCDGDFEQAWQSRAVSMYVCQPGLLFSGIKNKKRRSGVGDYGWLGWLGFYAYSG